MTAFSALTTTPDRASAEQLAEAVERLTPEPIGVGVFEVEGGADQWEVGVYFDESPDEAGLALAATMVGAAPFAVSEVGQTDWVALVRRELPPVRAGRFLVHGAHDRAAAKDVRYALEIEAAMAFGTGHHGTTRGCLTAIDRLDRIGVRPLRTADIGCGTGVLAMAAAALWKIPVVASDLDPIAVDTARANFRANGLGRAGMLYCAPGFRSRDIQAKGPYDLILANILARPLARLAPDMAANASRTGIAVLSGILNEQADMVEGFYRGAGFARMWRHIDGEWTTLVLRKRSGRPVDGTA